MIFKHYLYIHIYAHQGWNLWAGPHLGSQIIYEIGLGFPILGYSQIPNLSISPSELFYSLYPTTTLA